MLDGFIFSKSNSKPRTQTLLKNNGFTLIELLITIGIMAILVAATTTIINPSSLLKKARDADRKSDLRQIQVALEIFRSDEGGYPATVGYAGNCPDTGTPTMLVEKDSDGACPVDPTKVFLQTLPLDPKTNINYYYEPLNISASGFATGYRLYSCLENASDLEKLTLTSTPAIPSTTIKGSSGLNCVSLLGSDNYYGLVNQ